MSEYVAARLLVLVLGIAWSVIFYLGRRTLNSIESKIDASFKKIDGVNRLLSRTMERRGRACRKLFVSRQEFGAFTATINHKIDSIYEIVNKKPAEAE